MPPRILIALFVAVLCGSFATGADDEDAKKSAKKQFDESQSALVKGAYDKFVATNHPKLVEMLGGKEKMAAHLAKESKKMKADGFEFKSVRTADPSDPVRVGKDLYILIPATLEMSVPGGRLLTDSTGLGISSDGGKTWLFVNAVVERDQLLKILPDLPKAIVLPKMKPPIFIKD